MAIVAGSIVVPERELREEFLRAPGPGGQNVNKVETAVRLRFDARRSPSLPEPVRRRLAAVAGRRLTAGGEVVITARRHRTREQNRLEARERLAAMILKAATPPRDRRPTRPTPSSRRRRLEEKQRVSRRKRERQRPLRGEDG